MWGRVVLLAGMLSFNGSCPSTSDVGHDDSSNRSNSGNNNNSSNRSNSGNNNNSSNRSNSSNRNNSNNNESTRKVFELSFVNNTEVGESFEVEVGERFNVVVNNIDIDNISLSEEGEFTQQSGLMMTLKVMKNGKDILSDKFDIGSLGTSEEFNEWLHKQRIENDKAKFNGFYAKETCVNNCSIVIGLGFYHGPRLSDGSRAFHIVESVNEISKPIVIKESSYGLMGEKLHGNNLKLTFTKKDKPLTNGTAYVSVELPCLEYGWHGHYCIVPDDRFLLSNHRIEFDGSWATELDADGSWRAKQNEDYQFNICNAVLHIEVENRIFKKRLADSKGCG